MDNEIENKIDATNIHMVSMNSVGDILILNPPTKLLSRDAALTLAAWIVTLADPMEEEFNKHMKAVIGT